MKCFRRTYPVSIIVFLLYISCSENTVSTTPSILDQYAYTHDDSIEASDFALWLDAKLTSSSSTRDTLMFMMRHLRESFGDTAAVLLENRFMLPWAEGQVVVGFSDSAKSEILNGTYNGFDLLPEALLSFTQEGPDFLGMSLFEYGSPYHPWRLAEYFRQLPGVSFAEANGISFAGGNFPIFAGMTNGETTLLFAEDNFYMPTAIHYFRVINLQPEYIDVWSPLWIDEPSWWQSVLPVWQGFVYWGQ